MSTLNQIKRNRIIAVISGNSIEEALEFAEGCIKGGLKLIEVTFSFAGAETVISELSQRVGISVGAGTVLNLQMAQDALRAGSKFIVSPHTDKELISFAKSNNVLSIQGALTSSEMVNAWREGADLVKIFPAESVGGPSYVKAIKKPLPFMEIMATGGINYHNFINYIQAGVTAVGISGALLGSNKRIESKAISETAKTFVTRFADLERAPVQA